MTLPPPSGLRARVRAWRARKWLASASWAADDVVCAGRPSIHSAGLLTIGPGVFIGSEPVASHIVVGPGAVVEIGAGVAISYGGAIAAQRGVRIGPRTKLGPYVVIMDSDYHVAGDHTAQAEPQPVEIGEDVHIEDRVTVLRGSRIGARTRVVAGSVVSGDVPADSVVAGVPAIPQNDGLASAPRDLPSLVMATLNLAVAPALEHGPNQIPQWDSLGALKLLLAVERTYHISVSEKALREVGSVADLAKLVQESPPRHDDDHGA